MEGVCNECGILSGVTEKEWHFNKCLNALDINSKAPGLFLTFPTFHNHPYCLGNSVLSQGRSMIWAMALESLVEVILMREARRAPSFCRHR